MTSPPLDVIDKRRYHRHRVKAKRNKISSHHQKDATNMAIQQPRITQKRLTNKSGFHFKGAVLTASLLRNSRCVEHGLQKPKKGLKDQTDFDLRCLLQAAKSKRVSDPILSSSIGTSSGVDDPSSSVKHYSKEHKTQVKHKTREFQFPSLKTDDEIHSRSSSENNLDLFGNDNLDPEAVKQMGKDSPNKHCEFDTVHLGSHESVSVNDHTLDTNHSSDNSALQSKLRPCLSSYQKFAVGIVEALVSEKKKQLPYLKFGRDLERDLIAIYNKTHSKADCENVPSLDTKESEVCTRQVETSYFDSRTNETEPEHHFVSRIESEPKQEEEVNMYVKKDKSFREKIIQAWVEAIPQRIPCRNEERIGNSRNLTLECDRTQKTETEFLKNVVKGSPKFKATKPLKIIDNSTLWNMDDVKSPVFSPYMLPHKALEPVSLNKDLGPNRSEGARDIRSFFLPLNESEQFIGSNHNKYQPVELDSNFVSKKNKSYCPQRQSWTSWFQKSDENYKRGRQMSEPLSCLSPSITFDPPPAKHTWLTRMDSGDKMHANPKSQGRIREDRSSMWSQFPKLMRRDKEEVVYHEPVKYTGTLYTETETSPYIKFSSGNFF